MPVLRDYTAFGRNVNGARYGIEIEVEGRNLWDHDLPSNWVAKRDGSLGPSGIEYVTQRAFQFDLVETMLCRLSEFFKAKGSTIDCSISCSTHVHMNVQDLTPSEILKIACLYYILEDWLVDYSAGPDRVGNLFCLRLSDSEMPLWELRDSINNQTFPHIRETVRSAALNLCSLRRFGTLEFRSYRGIDSDPLEVLPWITILNELRQSALDLFDDPADMMSKFSMWGSAEFVRQVLSPESRRALGQYDEAALFEGVRRAQWLAFDANYQQLEARPNRREGF